MKYCFIFILFFFLTGCARTVSTGNETLFLEFKLTLNGNVDLNNTIYMIALSSTSSLFPQVFTLDEYFVIPGKNYNHDILATIPNRNITYYYNTYYKRWNQFLYIYNNSIDHVQASSEFFDSTTSDNFSVESTIGFEGQCTISPSNTLVISIDINQLGYQLSDTAYFTILSFEKDSTESGTIKDFLSDDSSHKINFIKHQTDSGNDTENGSLDAQFDIIQWQYRVY